MSTKLDKPLDEIVTAQRRNSVRRRSLRRTTAGRPTTTAPAGGVQKTAARANRGAAAKATPAKAAVAHGDSKVIVSNLVRCSQFPSIGHKESHLLTFPSPRT
jgi:THO complex subunit 4